MLKRRRSTGGIGCGIASLALASTLGAVAEAAPSEVRLSYRAPEGCGSEEQVLRTFTGLMGEGVEGEPLEATVDVRNLEGKLVLEFHATYRGVDSERTLEVEDCASATEAVAVLMLLIVDPDFASDLGAALDAPAPAPEPQPAPEPKHPSPPAKEAPPPSARGVPPAKPMQTRPHPKWVSLSPALSSGATPKLAVGGLAEGGVNFAPAEFVLGIAGHLGVSAEVPGVANSRVEASLLSLRGRAQARFHLGKLAFGPALGAGVDRVSLSTTGVSSPGVGATQWLSGRVGGFARHPLSGPLHLDLSAALVVPLQRPAFQVEGVGVVHRPLATGFELAFGMSWHWGSQS